MNERRLGSYRRTNEYSIRMPVYMSDLKNNAS